MLIEIEDSKRVKVTLEDYEMISYGLRHERLSKEDVNTCNFLLGLLALVRLQKNFNVGTKEFDVGAFPKGDGGCVLYISPHAKTSDQDCTTSHTSIVCECASLDILATLCKHLYKTQKDIIHDAQLFALDEKYRLILFTSTKSKDKLYPTIKEFAEVVDTDEIYHAKTKEHFKCLVEKDAIELMANTL